MALSQIGAATVADALDLWKQVPPTARVSTVNAWLDRAIDLVLTRRRASRDLARAYYRLVRALRTGRTIPDPRDPEPTYVTLDVLRREFVGLAGSDNPVDEPSPPRPSETAPEPLEGPEQSAEDEDDEDDGDDDDDQILIEELEALERQLEEEDRLAEEEARIALEALGPGRQAKKVEVIGDDAPASDVDRAREEANTQAGAAQAAAAARVAMDGARSEIWQTASRDPRVIGYVRLSRTGTPCGWCAMLISRGPVYRSEQSATYKGAASYEDGDKYHDNCNCYAAPIFSRDQFNDSDLYRLNREYGELWPRVTRGLSGKAAVAAWRRFIRTEQQAARAQAARAQTTTAQEA